MAPSNKGKYRTLLPKPVYNQQVTERDLLQSVADRTEDGDMQSMSTVSKKKARIGQRFISTVEVEILDRVPNQIINTSDAKHAENTETKAIVQRYSNGLKGFRIPFDDCIQPYMKKQCDVQFRWGMIRN